jgi:hypothetical protein
MKQRIICVGTLIDLVVMFEPDDEQESDELFQSILDEYNY